MVMSADQEVTPDLLQVSLEEEDRYNRLRLIHWWDQERLAQARVLVVGAGALGNEILKQLALLGVGKILVADLDTIELSNLTRAVLFRDRDVGRAKTEVAAERVEELNPEVRVQPFTGNIVYDLGAGVYGEMDIVFGALDNREARLAINGHCWNLGKPWVDGAIEVISGVARMFVPGEEAPCYECTMSEMDYQLLEQRRSCALLTREERLEGKVPTTPTTASVIAGIQVQEAIKWLHRDRDLPTLAGKGFVFNGLTHDSYVVEYQRRADCPAHDTFPEVIPTDLSVDTPVREVLEFVRREVSPQAVVDLSREVCVGVVCRKCEWRIELFRSLGKVTEEEARCERCGEVGEPQLMHSLYGDEPFLDKTLAELGLPPYDIFAGREGLEMKHYLLAADRGRALGKIG